MLKLESESLSAVFDGQSGRCQEICGSAHGRSYALTAAGHLFDIYVEDRPLLGERRAPALLEHSACSLCFVHQRSGIRVRHRVRLTASTLRQSVEIYCEEGGERRLTEIRYVFTGFSLGDLTDVLVHADGSPDFLDVPYGECAGRRLDADADEPLPDYPEGWLEPCPDQCYGKVSLFHSATGVNVSAWHASEKAPAFPALFGKNGRPVLQYRHKLAHRLVPGAEAVSEGACLLFTAGTRREHLTALAETYNSSVRYISPPGDTPDWLRSAALLQINPRPVIHWTERLKEIAGMGFTLIYLLPVWENAGNPYSIVGHYAVDGRDGSASAVPPEQAPWNASPFGVGTARELREFVNKAHALGLRVVFDFVPQGVCAKSEFAREHSEWLCKDPLSRPYGSHGWGPRPGAPVSDGTYSLDWGNSEYRKYAVDWAIWNVREFDIDGFRTDALHWKEPNWHPAAGEAPWRTCYGGVELANELRAALKAVKPDAVLLGEVWGPLFNASHDATYEDGWLLRHVNEGWLRGEPRLSAGQWMRLLRDAALVRREEPKLTFTMNHDSAELSGQARGSAVADAVSVTHIFSGGLPFVWQSELPGREAFFREALRLRGRLSEHACRLDIDLSSDHVFAALWLNPGKPAALVLTNPSPFDAAAEIRLPVHLSGCLVPEFHRDVRLYGSGALFAAEIASGGYGILGEEA